MRDVFELTTLTRPSCFLFLLREKYRPYNETPTKGPVMNVKEKFEAAKEKAKFHKPELIVLAVTIAAGVIGVGYLKKQYASGAFDPFVPVDDATREEVFGNKDFLLYKLTENEYMLDRPVSNN